MMLVGREMGRISGKLRRKEYEQNILHEKNYIKINRQKQNYTIKYSNNQ